MFDWNNAIDKHNAGKKQRNLLEMLDRLVESVLRENKLNEGSDDIPGSEAVFNDPNFSIPLPTVKISEAWGKKGTKDREIIENYTRNIPGATLDEKLANLNRVLNEGAAGTDLSQIISTMMVCEILFAILTDFTEAAGGFIFEGFLAGLFGKEAKQIKGPQDIEGMKSSGKPITDVILGDKHYSLKLLGPSTGVKGSFQNMVAHFKTGLEYGFDHVVYLDARRIEGNQGLEFFEFEVRLDNFIDVFVVPFLVESKKIELPFEKAEEFKAGLEKVSKEKKAIKDIVFATAPKELGLRSQTYSYSMAKGEKQKIDEIKVSGEDLKKIIQTILSTDNETLQKYGPFKIYYTEEKFEGSKAEKLFGSYGNVDKLKRLIDSGDKVAIVDFLAELPGAQKEQQFLFTPGQAASIKGGRSIGRLMVGEDYMKKAWASYADVLKRTIGPVYQELKQFSDDLNSYILGKTGEQNVEDRKQYALNAIEDSKRLNVATENAVKELEK